ncbi:MAG: hypothetical protein GXO39_01820, partial [Thermotogae bacterium]|nr:hypothetical protein [Thermotogota bacterium]
MLLLALTSIYWLHEDVRDTLFGDWIVWDGFKLLKPSQPPSEPKGYDLKVGSLVAIGDTWYNDPRLPTHEGGTPI